MFLMFIVMGESLTNTPACGLPKLTRRRHRIHRWGLWHLSPRLKCCYRLCGQPCVCLSSPSPRHKWGQMSDSVGQAGGEMAGAEASRGLGCMGVAFGGDHWQPHRSMQPNPEVQPHLCWCGNIVAQVPLNPRVCEDSLSLSPSLIFFSLLHTV